MPGGNLMNWAKPPSSQHTASSSMMQERERSRASNSTMPAVVEVAETLLASRIADFFDSIDLGNPVCSLCTAD